MGVKNTSMCKLPAGWCGVVVWCGWWYVEWYVDLRVEVRERGEEGGRGGTVQCKASGD